MALTVANAIKQILEEGQIGVAVFRDRWPENAPLPYVTVRDGIASSPSSAFNQWDDSDGHISEMVQVDTWQRWKAGNQVVEDASLPDLACRILRGSTVTGTPFQIVGIRISDGPRRLLEMQNNLVHHVVTLDVFRTTRWAT